MKFKKLPSLQFVITEQISLLSPLNSNDRSIPLRSAKIDSKESIPPAYVAWWAGTTAMAMEKGDRF
jgi:hypothetical protein